MAHISRLALMVTRIAVTNFIAFPAAFPFVTFAHRRGSPHTAASPIRRRDERGLLDVICTTYSC